MRKFWVFFICMMTVFSFVGCKSSDQVLFTEADNKTVVSNDGTEYIYVGSEVQVCSFGELDFLGHIKGEKKSFVHLATEIKTGMYAVGGEQDVLVRYFPDNEFFAVYVKSDLLTTEVALENCIGFDLVKAPHFDNSEAIVLCDEAAECQAFLQELQSAEKAKEAGLYDLVKQPDGSLKNCYLYGWICGVIQEDLNLFIRLDVTSYDDQAYSVRIDAEEYVLSSEWIG